MTRGYKDRFPRLPPGCTPSDIPGNRPEDVAWDEFIEESDTAVEVFKDFYDREPDDRFELVDKAEIDEDFRDSLETAFEEKRYEEHREPPEPDRPDREAHEGRID